MDLQAEASANFTRHIEQNSYPGRGLVLGRSSDAVAWLQVYWIMGRSPNSRNRIFEAEGATLRTAPHDPATLRDPSLVIYEAMLELPDVHIVSNGDRPGPSTTRSPRVEASSWPCRSGSGSPTLRTTPRASVA